MTGPSTAPDSAAVEADPHQYGQHQFETWGWPQFSGIDTGEMNREGEPIVGIQNIGSLPFGLPAPQPWNSSGWFNDPDRKNAYSHQWHVEVQREMTRNLMVGVGYVGSYNGRMEYSGYAHVPASPAVDQATGRRLTPAERDRLRPWPHITGSFRYEDDIGMAKYNAFQLRVQQRFSQGLATVLSYTLSRSVDTSSGWFAAENGIGGGSNVQNYHDIDDARAVSSYDIPHLLTWGGLWELPVGRRRRWLSDGPASWILGDWQLNWGLLARSGQPYTLTVGGDPANIGVSGYARPNVVGDPELSNPNAEQWFNRAAFAIPVNEFGNSERNSLRAPGFWNVNLGLQKNIPIGGDRRLDFRVQAFNVFNHINLGNPDVRIDQPTAGRITYWIKRSLDYIRTQPIDWLTLTARKLALTFNAAEIADTESQDVYAEWSWLLRVLRPFDFGLLFGVAALGTVLTAHSWRRLWFLYAVGATYALSVVIFYVFARYRFPIVLILMVLAAGGLIEALSSLHQRTPQKLAMATGVAVLAVAFAHLPLDDERASRATHDFGIGSVLSKEPAQVEQAMGFYKRALDEAPEFPAAQFGLGTLLARVDRAEEAIPYYRAALESWPAHAEARYNLGMAFAAAGQAQEASEQYSEALRIHPDDADTHIALAKVLIALNRPDVAVEHYQQGLALQPKNAKALVGLGVALTQLGRPREAIEKYRLALELDPQEADAHNNLGWTLASEGRIAEAVPHFERAVALNPNDENAKRNLDRARQIQR